MVSALDSGSDGPSSSPGRRTALCSCARPEPCVTMLACSKRSDSGERCEFALLFTSHRSPLSERLEQAITMQEPCTRLPDVISVTLSILEYMYMRRVTRKSLPETSEVER